MNRIFAKIAFAIGLVMAISPVNAAPGAVSLQGDVKLDKAVVENGATRHVLVTPQKVVPGDRLVFSTNYKNNGGAPVENFVVTNPLPKGVTYANEGAAGSAVSVDGGKTWGALQSLKVMDGKGGLRPAQSNDVTHMRWTVAVIAPGATGAVSYHAVVR